MVLVSIQTMSKATQLAPDTSNPAIILKYLGQQVLQGLIGSQSHPLILLGAQGLVESLQPVSLLE